MTILRRQFHSHEKGIGNETWHYLARDTETGRVFVVKETSTGGGKGSGGYSASSVEISLEDFLGGHASTAKRRLIELIGTLIEPHSD